MASTLREPTVRAIVRDLLQKELKNHDARVELGAALPHHVRFVVVETAPVLGPLSLHHLHYHLCELDHHVGRRVCAILPITRRRQTNVDVVRQILHNESLHGVLLGRVIRHPLGNNVHLHAV